MKKKCFMFIILLCTMMLVGCGTEDQVKLDLYQYLNTDVKPLSSMHNEAIAAYNAFMEEEDGDSEQLISSLSDIVIPAMEQVEQSLGKLSYASDEVNTYAAEYQAVVGQEIEALETVVSAVQNKSEDELAKANTKISDAMQAMDKYQTGIRTFAASYGLTLVEQETESVER